MKWWKRFDVVWCSEGYLGWNKRQLIFGKKQKTKKTTPAVGSAANITPYNAGPAGEVTFISFFSFFPKRLALWNHVDCSILNRCDSVYIRVYIVSCLIVFCFCHICLFVLLKLWITQCCWRRLLKINFSQCLTIFFLLLLFNHGGVDLI